MLRVAKNTSPSNDINAHISNAMAPTKQLPTEEMNMEVEKPSLVPLPQVETNSDTVAAESKPEKKASKRRFF